MTDLDAMRKAPAEPRVSDENLAEQIKVHEMLGFEKTSDCKVRYDLRDARARADTAEQEIERLTRELVTAKRETEEARESEEGATDCFIEQQAFTRAAETALAAANETIEMLCEALEPFAKEAGQWGPAPEGWQISIDGAHAMFTVDDLRRAVSAIASARKTAPTDGGADA